MHKLDELFVQVLRTAEVCDIKVQAYFDGDTFVNIRFVGKIDKYDALVREECRKKQAAGVKFEYFRGYEWVRDTFDFCGNKEDYREVPQEPLQAASDAYRAEKGHPPFPSKISQQPHVKERALYWAQRAAGTNEVWLEQASDNNGCWWEVDNDFEPEWIPKHKYRVKPMKLTARIVRRKELPFDPFKAQVQDWEFYGTREEYRVECEKYGYFVVSEIREVAV